MYMNLVSVIIPVYQVSDNVERCVLSVMAQSYTTIECILIDDKTQDDSIIKCERLIEEYKGPIRFKILHHGTNRGLSAARNTGTLAASGEYVFYLDSDDEITSDCIEKLVSAAQANPAAEIVVGNTQVYKDGKPGKIWIKDEVPSVLNGNDTIVSFYHRKLIPNAVWNKLIKISFIKDNGLYNKEGIIHEDILWMFYVMKYLSQIVLVKDVTSHYLIRPGSISTSASKSEEGSNYMVVYDDIIHNLTKGREKKEIRRYMKDFCKCSLAYGTMFPYYKKLHKFFLIKSLRFFSWKSSFVLASTGLIGCFKNPSTVFNRLNGLRSKTFNNLKRI